VKSDCCKKFNKKKRKACKSCPLLGGLLGKARKKRVSMLRKAS